MRAISEFTGQIYELTDCPQHTMRCLAMLPGLRNNERDLLGAIITLCGNTSDARCDEADVATHFKKTTIKMSTANIKHKVVELERLNIFSRYTVPRPRTRPAIVYKLNDLDMLATSEELVRREREISSRNKPVKRSIVPKTENVLKAEKFEHAYSRKLTQIILRRCSSDPDHLGKRLTVPVPGFEERVEVTQRVATGIPAMDGSEDRLKQCLLTMFKEHVRELSAKHGAEYIKNLKNTWLLDMRAVCATLHLSPSSGNIIVQSKRLYQLRYNSFEIQFDPEGEIAQGFNLIIENYPKHHFSDYDQSLYKIKQGRIDQQFLASLEPVESEFVWSNQQSLPLTVEERDVTERDWKSLIYDSTGSLYRFYQISFHPFVFEECVNDALGQLQKHPISLLLEERLCARLLTYLAERIFTETNIHSFEASWLEIANEIQPLKKSAQITNVFGQMLTIFKNTYEKSTGNDFDVNNSPKILLHGYNYEILIPNGATRRKNWKLRITPEKRIEGNQLN